MPEGQQQSRTGEGQIEEIALKIASFPLVKNQLLSSRIRHCRIKFQKRYKLLQSEENNFCNQNKIEWSNNYHILISENKAE
jgi:hypothetical protein